MSNPRSAIAETTRVRNRSRRVTMIVAQATLLVILLSGCTREKHSQDVGQYPSAIEQLAVRRKQLDPLFEAQTRGRKVYEHYCQICHGEEAQGHGFNSAMLDPLPRNFADEAFWKQTDNKRLRKVISQGGKAVGKSVLMPPWGGTVDENQIRDVILFLRTVPELAKQTALAAEAEEEESDNGE